MKACWGQSVAPTPPWSVNVIERFVTPVVSEVIAICPVDALNVGVEEAPGPITLVQRVECGLAADLTPGALDGRPGRLPVAVDGARVPWPRQPWLHRGEYLGKYWRSCVVVEVDPHGRRP